MIKSMDRDPDKIFFFFSSLISTQAGKSALVELNIQDERLITRNYLEFIFYLKMIDYGLQLEIPRLEITDVESATNNHLYFPLFPTVSLRCLLLDSLSSSLSLTRRPFCERR